MNDLEVYKKAISVLSRGENIALITVISTTGSTPGKVGYKMLVRGDNGETIGTVGGGLTEANVINTAKKTLPKTENQVAKFNLDGTEDNEKGICGGSIEFLIETFDKKSLPLFKELLAVIENGVWGVLISIIRPNKTPEKIFLKSVDQLDTIANIHFSSKVTASIKELVAKQRPAKKTLEDGAEIFIETFAEQPMVFIFGAGHLSYHISRYAKSVNFRVTVCDDRAEFANKNRFPDASNIIVEGYERIFDKIDINKNSYIVIVTQGHKSDEIVLEKAVKTNAKYVGMIGSKRKTLTILKSLQQRGIPAKTLKRIYSPIGISIGAFTPEEIALSIVCELVKIRRLGDAPETSHMRIAFPEGLQEENL
ncbi:MAG: XdhC family protein [Sedimentisphaerales bacterium]|jgi:xanthine dehydrogenase accessory factor